PDCPITQLPIPVQTAPVLHTPSLRRPASIVRNGSDIADRLHFQTGSSQGANGGLASRARTADPHFQGTHAMIARLVGGVHGCLLRRKGSAFARTAEAERAGALPGQRAPFTIGDGHNSVVERGLNVGHAVRHILAFLLLENFLLALRRRRCCAGCCSCCWFCHSLSL